MHLRRTLAASAATFACTAGLAVAAPTPAHAEPVRAIYEVINVSTYDDYVDYINRMARCKVNSAGSRCTVTVTKALATSVQVDLGVTAAWVAG